MSKRSAAVAELESHLREMIGPSGGLSETRWVGRLVELMRETANTEGREYLLKVVLATPDRPTLTRFIQLGGVELLGQWINEHRKQTGQEDRQVLHTMLSCLNKLNISRETMQRTEIGKVVNSLSKHTDSSISAKAASIVAKWKKQVAEPAEESKSARQMTKVKETRVTVVPVPAKRPVDEPIRFLPMDPPPPSVEPYQPVRRVRWVEDEYLALAKFFYRNDEPNSRCASERPPEEFEAQTKLISLDDFRKREDMMTRELSKKVLTKQEKLAEGQMHEQLRNMRPVVTYSSLPRRPYSGVKILSTTRKGRVESSEVREQLRRESDLLRVTYARESDIPQSPREPPSRAETTIVHDTSNFPLVNKTVRPPIEDKPLISPPQSLYPMMQSMMPTMPMGMPMPFMPTNDPAMMQMWAAYPPASYLSAKKKIQIDPRTNKPVNYKTVPCKMFHSPQGCTRGESCHFIHETNFTGRPIPSDWKRSNEARQKSMKDAETVVPPSMPYYYTAPDAPPFGSR